MTVIRTQAIEQLVLRAVQNSNRARVRGEQLSLVPDGVIFGPGSPLDSLGLVALLIDIEETFADEGMPITLSDERALSQRHSPFRTMTTLVTYIQGLLDQP